jgi:enolase-phosphatase E1
VIPSAVLLDIEGTTTPISFVYDVLFPFARKRLPEYLRAQADEADLAQLRAEYAEEVAPPSPASDLTSYALWLMDQDRKSTGLKSIQGKIWEQGYRDSALHSEVFPDVALALTRWKETGKKIAIFSSGSVLAQKLLFAHSNKGDLTSFIDSYFDTTTGPKKKPESYSRIASTMRLTPAEVLFISDVTSELDAAAAAGMRTLLCVRPGNHPQTNDQKHRIIQSFDEIV